MQNMKLRSHVGSDGILHLQVPVGVTDAEVEVTMTLQTITPAQDAKTPEELGWSPGFFERTFGSIPNLKREPQGELQKREPFDIP